MAKKAAGQMKHNEQKERSVRASACLPLTSCEKPENGSGSEATQTLVRCEKSHLYAEERERKREKKKKN